MYVRYIHVEFQVDLCLKSWLKLGRSEVLSKMEEHAREDGIVKIQLLLLSAVSLLLQSFCDLFDRHNWCVVCLCMCSSGA